MARARTITAKGIVGRFSEAMAAVKGAGDYVFVVRGVPRSIVMRCPDGCGEVLTVNLDRRSGPAWRHFEREGRLTVYPSVWREDGCGAHFILWNDRILWCDTGDSAPWRDAKLMAAVRSALPKADEPHRHYEEIALELGAIPWEVLWACGALQRAGEASGAERGTKFRRSAAGSRRGRYVLDVET